MVGLERQAIGGVSEEQAKGYGQGSAETSRWGWWRGQRPVDDNPNDGCSRRLECVCGDVMRWALLGWVFRALTSVVEQTQGLPVSILVRLLTKSD